MKGDFSRLTFDAKRHFTSVRLQQGRVLHEADANEEADIVTHRLDRTFRDVIGDAASPVDPDSFKVAVAANKITVSPGRFYLGGRLLENDAQVTLPAQPFLSGGYCVLDTGAPAFGVATLPQGEYAVVLDSWVRHVTVLEMPELLEPALGGVTTATRFQSVWQLKLMKLPGGTNCGGVKGTAAWLANAGPITALMEADTETPPPAPDKCDLSPSGGFQGLENDLYRVEIHAGGPANVATYKWTIDNASFAALATSWDNAKTLTIASAPGDLVRGFQIGDTVELIDVETELRELPGTMLVIDDILGETILFKTPHGLGAAADGAAAAARKLRVRRWVGPLTVPKNTNWIALGTDGVRIRFDKDMVYKTGQFWAFPARTATNDIEWPGGKQPPQNIPHLLTPLARIGVDGMGNITLLGDCRSLFPPLSAMISLLYVGGDGQEAEAKEVGNTTPLALARPLTVAVMRGKLPVVGAPVEFKIVSGAGGRLNGAAVPAKVYTGADGLASVTWALDPGVKDASQQVEARMLDDGNAGFGNPVRFAARSFSLVEMKLAGGDTQTQVNPGGVPLVELNEPLRVAVTRSNLPLAGARVRFSTSGGGGTVRAVGSATTAATVDIITDAEGMAECLWALVPDGPHEHVLAQLMADPVKPWGAPNVRFSGSLFDLPKGGSCCVTVGKDGDFETLDEAMEKLLNDDEINDICICLIAGDHAITRPIVVDQRDKFNLSIHGCGPATRLNIGDNLIFLNQMGAFEIADLQLVTNSGVIIALALESVSMHRVIGFSGGYILASQQCRTVSVEDCDLSIGAPQAIVRTEGSAADRRKRVNEAKAVRAGGSFEFLDTKAVMLPPKLGFPAALPVAKDLIVFADFDSDVRILRNRIHGSVNFGADDPIALPFFQYLADWKRTQNPIKPILRPGGTLTIMDNLMWDLRVTGLLARRLGFDDVRPPNGVGEIAIPTLSRFERNQLLAIRSVLPGLCVIVGSNHFTVNQLRAEQLLVIAPRDKDEGDTNEENDDDEPVVKIVGNLGPRGSVIISTGTYDEVANAPMVVVP